MTDTSQHKPHILFICGRNQWRSRVAERIYANDQRIEVRSAGVSPISPHQVSRQDLEWADLVLVMEPKDPRKNKFTFSAQGHSRYRRAVNAGVKV